MLQNLMNSKSYKKNLTLTSHLFLLCFNCQVSMLTNLGTAATGSRKFFRETEAVENQKKNGEI